MYNGKAHLGHAKNCSERLNFYHPFDVIMGTLGILNFKIDIKSLKKYIY